jgi:hypothetical protein
MQVLLVHGMGRTPLSMLRLGRKLRRTRALRQDRGAGTHTQPTTSPRASLWESAGNQPGLTSHFPGGWRRAARHKEGSNGSM